MIPSGPTRKSARYCNITLSGNRIIELGMDYDTPNSTPIFHRIANLAKCLQPFYITKNQMPLTCSFYSEE